MCIFKRLYVFHPKFYYVHALVLLPMEMHVLARASPPTLSCSLGYVNPAKIFLTSKVLVTNSFLFPTPPIKLKLELQVGGRLVIANHLDQSYYLPN
jgi:hypothetical protein